MGIILPVDSLFSATAHKRLGRPCEYGFSGYAFTAYGAEFSGVIFDPFGVAVFGDVIYGDYLNISGIYQKRHTLKGPKTVLEKFYTPTDTPSVAKTATRVKFRAAIVAWQGLGLDARKVYNGRVWGRHMSGYNLFVREYMYG